MFLSEDTKVTELSNGIIKITEVDFMGLVESVFLDKEEQEKLYEYLKEKLGK